jgi:hypothetical protein
VTHRAIDSGVQRKIRGRESHAPRKKCRDLRGARTRNLAQFGHLRWIRHARRRAQHTPPMPISVAVDEAQDARDGTSPSTDSRTPSIALWTVALLPATIFMISAKLARLPGTMRRLHGRPSLADITG